MTKFQLNRQQIAELEEILKLTKKTEQKAREMSELSTIIAWKYQKKIQILEENQEENNKKSNSL